MNGIVIGKSDKHNVTLDLDVLLTTRMLLTADSGGGKTWALKRIIEQAFKKIQIIAIDPEGEFAPLREKFGFVLVGKGGETPADVRSARLVAQTLLKLRASAICDLYEMKPSERHIWVRDFCDGLLESPKEYRHPCLVIVDEAHMFCPEHGKGESAASDAVIGLCTRGRKRLLVPLFATQRLATLSKDASSMLLNRMVGGSFEDVNRKRAADVLGIAKEKGAMQEFFDEIKTLEAGDFFCLGRAISKERVLVHVGAIDTAHGQDALKYELKPPPAPESIANLLPKLSDLPKQAEEKAKTEAEYKTQIRSLKAQLVAAMQVKQQPASQIDMRKIQVAVKEAQAQLMKEIGERDKTIRKLLTGLGTIAKDAAALTGVKLPPVKLMEVRVDKLPVSAGHAVHIPDRTETRKSPAQHGEARGTAGMASNGDISSSQLRILKALAELDAIGQAPAAKETVAFWSEQRSTSGGYFNNLGKLRSMGLIDYPNPGTARLTEEGRQKIGTVEAPSSEEVIRRVESLLSGSQIRILEVLRVVYPEPIAKDELAERSGQKSTSGGYFNNLGSMRTAGLLDYPRPGVVKAAEWLFSV